MSRIAAASPATSRHGMQGDKERGNLTRDSEIWLATIRDYQHRGHSQISDRKNKTAEVYR